MGVRVGFRAGVDALEIWKILFLPAGIRTPDFPSCLLVAVPNLVPRLSLVVKEPF